MIEGDVVHHRDARCKIRDRTVALVNFADEFLPVTDPGGGEREIAEVKFFISAPFTIVGFLPARCRIQPIMPVVVDFPLVPATPMPQTDGLNSSARSFARVVTAAPMRRAACTSGTVSSTAAEVTKI